jgi:hypothetical protein
VEGEKGSLIGLVDTKNKIFDISGAKVKDAVNDTDQMQNIQTIIQAIIRMHVIIHEYRESSRKSTTGTKQFNFDSQISAIFDQAYRDCIQVKGMGVIKRFIDGLDSYMNLNKKTASDQDKTVEELDIIKYIETSNAQYRELNDSISTGMKNVFPPRREEGGLAHVRAYALDGPKRGHHRGRGQGRHRPSRAQAAAGGA